MQDVLDLQSDQSSASEEVTKKRGAKKNRGNGRKAGREQSVVEDVELFNIDTGWSEEALKGGGSSIDAKELAGLDIKDLDLSEFNLDDLHVSASGIRLLAKCPCSRALTPKDRCHVCPETTHFTELRSVRTQLTILSALWVVDMTRACSSSPMAKCTLDDSLNVLWGSLQLDNLSDDDEDDDGQTEWTTDNYDSSVFGEVNTGRSNGSSSSQV